MALIFREPYWKRIIGAWFSKPAYDYALGLFALVLLAFNIHHSGSVSMSTWTLGFISFLLGTVIFLGTSHFNRKVLSIETFFNQIADKNGIIDFMSKVKNIDASTRRALLYFGAVNLVFFSSTATLSSGHYATALILKLAGAIIFISSLSRTLYLTKLLYAMKSAIKIHKAYIPPTPISDDEYPQKR